MKLKPLIVIAIFIIAMIGGAFYISLQKDVEVLTVEVTLARPPGNDSDKIISNVSAYLSYARRMEVPEGTPLSMPGITVIAMQNMREVSGWYSVPIPIEGFYGSYNITIKLSNKIDRSQPISILARMVDPAGKDVSVRSAEIKLQQ